MLRRVGLLIALLSLAFTAPVHAQREAPNKEGVVKAVMAAHPEIDRCDESSLDKGRALIVDWTAQRLNAEAGRVVWGRKSRGRVVNGKADRPNTDGLAFLRSDGRYEIYDVVSGSRPCNSTWGEHGPIVQGENGWWAPPQLGPERPGTGGGGTGGGDEEEAELRARVAALETDVENLHRANADQAITIRQLTDEREHLRRVLANAESERDQARQELEALKNREQCQISGPGWVRDLFRIRLVCPE
jgi:hypothetical protein